MTAFAIDVCPWSDDGGLTGGGGDTLTWELRSSRYHRLRSCPVAGDDMNERCFVIPPGYEGLAGGLAKGDCRPLVHTLALA